MARRPKTKSVDEMIEGFKGQDTVLPGRSFGDALDAQEAPPRPSNNEVVMLTKKTWLYGAEAPAGTLATVPTTIANVLRAKGIVK